MPHAQSEPRADALARALSAVALEQELLEGLGVDDGRIADRVDAGGDRTVDLSKRDFVSQHDRGFEARAAGPLQVEPGGFRGETRAEHGFAGQVPLARMLHDGARRHVVDPLAIQSISVDDTAQDLRQHLLIPYLPHTRRYRGRREYGRRRSRPPAADLFLPAYETSCLPAARAYEPPIMTPGGRL